MPSISMWLMKVIMLYGTCMANDSLSLWVRTVGNTTLSLSKKAMK